jgi:hypothetical protein
MYAAPVGAFGAMAFTIGKYGIDTLTSLGKLMALFYGTSIFFVLVVLGGIAWLNGVNIYRGSTSPGTDWRCVPEAHHGNHLVRPAADSGMEYPRVGRRERRGRLRVRQRDRSR